MRTFVSAVAVIIGLLLSAVAVPAIWVDRNVVQEDGFVALAAPLARTPTSSSGSRPPLWAPSTQASDPGRADGPRPAGGRSGGRVADRPARLPGSLGRDPPEEPPAELCRPRVPARRSGLLTSLTLDVAPLVALAAEELSRTTGLPLDAPGADPDQRWAAGPAPDGSSGCPLTPRWATPWRSARESHSPWPWWPPAGAGQ